VTGANEEGEPMLNRRAIPAALLAAALSLSLLACSEEHAASILDELDWYARQLQENWNQDPFNRYFSRDQDFAADWPPGVPTPDAPRFHHNAPHPTSEGERVTAFYNPPDPAEIDAYVDRLGNSGMEKVSESRETDAKTGWEKSTTVFKDGNGRTVEVFRSGGPKESVSVSVTTPVAGSRSQ
jgi:hypothetical protein